MEGQVVSDLEHISSILSRAFKELVQTWDQQREEEGVGVKDQEHNTPTEQI
jgi:hypothetical protein